MFVKPKSAGVGWPTPLRNFILTLLWRTTFSCCSILLTILAYDHTFVLRFYDAIPTPLRLCISVEKKKHPIWRPTDTILYSGHPCTRRKMISMATTYITSVSQSVSQWHDNTIIGWSFRPAKITVKKAQGKAVKCAKTTVGSLSNPITPLSHGVDNFVGVLSYIRTKKGMKLRILCPSNGYSTLSWVRMCDPKSDHHPITKPEKTQICYLYLNHSFLEGPFLKPISAFYNVNWDA